MQLFGKKRISIIVENAFRDRVIKLIETSGASGFTVYKAIYGKGQHGISGEYGGLREISGNVEIVTITGPEVAEQIIQGLQSMLDKGIVLIVHVADVNVIRNEHFR